MLTGHGGFAAYLHRFHIKDSPSCICDPDCEENIWHILFECPRFGLERIELETQIQLDLKPENLPTIMENQTTRTPFLAFGSRAVQIAAKRNGAKVITTASAHTTPATTSTSTTPHRTNTTLTSLYIHTTNTTPTIITGTTTTGSSNVSPTSIRSSDPDPLRTEQIHRFLDSGENGSPGVRIRAVALFMDNDAEKLGLSFCRVGSRNHVAISPGLASLLYGSTTKTSMKRRNFDALPESRVADHPFRIVRSQNKVIALFEWGTETPFAQACSVLTVLGEDANNNPRIISVDAMMIERDRGNVADRYGCLKASEHHEVVVYEDRGEDLSFLKVPKHDAKSATTSATSSNSNSVIQSGSERLQERQRAKELQNQQQHGSPKERTESARRVESLITNILPTLATGIDRRAAAVADFLRLPPRKPRQPSPVRTRADKGQVSPPSLVPESGPLDYMTNAFLEFQAIVRATKEVNRITCENILQAFRRDNIPLLKVRLEEADAAVYNSDTGQVIIGNMSGHYMAAYNASCGFVARSGRETERTEHPKFDTPEHDPIVVVAKCTRIMLDDGILRTAQAVSGDPKSETAWRGLATPKIRWVNGVPGCGKTTGIVADFEGDRDVIITTTIEAAKELRAKLAHRLGDQARSKVRTMASVLANGFRESENCNRLTVDEALMNHFGAIVMAARLSGATELVLFGDINQLPYFDRENLFEVRYSKPDLVTSISQELFCTHRNPMDVAFALKDVYAGMYSSRPRVRSLKLHRYTDALIPKDLPNTLYLFHTQEEKVSHTSQGYGVGPGSRVLTIHEAQGLTCESAIVIQSKGKKLRLHDSVPHAVVALSRHTNTCVYYTDNWDDAIGRLMGPAVAATVGSIQEHNLKMAMRNRDMVVVEGMLQAK